MCVCVKVGLLYFNDVICCWPEYVNVEGKATASCHRSDRVLLEVLLL